MAKIVYGVSGEGSGHSSRAKLIGKHLLDTGHDLKVVSYDRGYRNLHDTFDVLEIVGLSIASRDNSVSMLRTLSDNVAKLPDGTRTFNKLRALFKSFQPDCVISDLEPCTAYLAGHYDLLDRLGLGKECLMPTVDAIAAFLYRLLDYESALVGCEGCGNLAIQRSLDELLALDLRLLKTYER